MEQSITRHWCALLLLAAPFAAQAQTGAVGIGTTNPEASAALDVSSTTKGVLLPRLSLVQRQAMGTGSIAAPVAGLVIYQTDNTPGLYAYDGSGWVRLSADNLGDHTATRNLNLSNNQLVGVSRLGLAAGADAYGVGDLSAVAFQYRANGGGGFAHWLRSRHNSGLAAGGNSLDFYLNNAATAAGSVAPGVLSSASPTGAGAGTIQVLTLESYSGQPRVGVGTAAPSQALDVVGNARVTNALVGAGDSLSNGIVGVGVRTDGGLNLGQNTAGTNIFLGFKAGQVNSTGDFNQFSGYKSGYRNTAGRINQFDGFQSGYSNTTGSVNLFTGVQSGFSNTTGGYNHFIGTQSGAYTTTGNFNLFAGFRSGFNNTTGSNNTALGYNAGPSTGALTNATAIGAYAVVSQDNSLVLGGTGTNAVSVGIGTSSPVSALDVAGVTGDIHAGGAVLARALVSTEYQSVSGPSKGTNNQYHTAQCNSGWGVAIGSISTSSSGPLDGDLMVNCANLTYLLRTFGSWRNGPDYSADNQTHRVDCLANEVATGIRFYASGYFDGGPDLFCQPVVTDVIRGASFRSAWGTANNFVSNSSTQFGCPPGTYLTGMSVYANSYLDRNLFIYCATLNK